jgi:DNA-binding response OmpR family regulator
MNTAFPLAPSAPRPVILLVDDTPANLDLLRAMLSPYYDLRIANRGAKALAICASSEPIDLLLLDVMMPEMDGFTVCRALRAQPATRELPIIFLTAKHETEDIVSGFACGANDYITKPFRPPELLLRIKMHLRQRAQQREIETKNTELKEMLHIISHDVRNHFSVLSMALDIITLRPEVGLAKYLPLIATAVRNGIRLTSVVRDLRHADDNPLALDAVSLPTALAEALLLAKSKLIAKKITVTNEVPAAVILAEPHSLTSSVLGNLLDNAIKFSSPGGTIVISATVEAEAVCLSFKDWGIGMPLAVQAHLFDISRSNSRMDTDGQKGSGFGMPLMARLMKRYGGAIEVISRDIATHPDDHGTEFKIWFKRPPHEPVPAPLPLER